MSQFFQMDGMKTSKAPGQIRLRPGVAFALIERTTLFFHSPTASAFEQIERFSNHRQASREFADQKLQSQDERDFIPNEITFQDIVADQYYFACSPAPQYPYPFLGCIYLVQYGAYSKTLFTSAARQTTWFSKWYNFTNNRWKKRRL
ncbi:MAG: hypothetical protein ACOYYU_05000 [Chloroflexota bacterium]